MGMESGEHCGKDFLFLFDLLAHTSGLESTLRLLTYADADFQNMCQPRFIPQPLEVIRIITYLIFILESLKG